MINTFDIKGFKSVKDIHLECRRVNLFIGEPNTGKSNILEALGFLSWCGNGGNLFDFVRLAKMRDLFYDGLAIFDSWRLKINNKIIIAMDADDSLRHYNFSNNREKIFANFALSDEKLTAEIIQNELAFIKFYHFKQILDSKEIAGRLLPPFGQNLFSLIHLYKELRIQAGSFFEPYGLELVINAHENKLEVQKRSDAVVISYPFHLTSDTLQRMVFYTAAIETNKESTLVFEEPEAHAFPYFTKHLGERIALDENKNQYFIATHNPYLLSAVREKAPAEEVAVFATYYRDYQTRVKMLTEDELSRLFEQDPILAVNQFVEEEK